ncbi:hypothetical protein [Tropicimonas sp. IMCC6043]|uniref:hypothetical protein n=1 Tax=Tropicimonas sp. IMCC6043 TaxID=2510645 RepID=UPI0013EC39FD|nr:hypothetical protein [Tropicimonas sp. IMCC6043]
MKMLGALLVPLSALPAVAHDAGSIAHVHPHGMEVFAVAAVGLAFAGYVAWKARNR